jgi:hypothetical protein
VKRQQISPTDPVCAASVAALHDDPFYRSIMIDLSADDARRDLALAQYFAYSIEEGTRIGRTVRISDATAAVAVWLLPTSAEVKKDENLQKRNFLRDLLGPRGYSIRQDH